jgi:predicted DNA-binding transcriptional regulator AlpA
MKPEHSDLQMLNSADMIGLLRISKATLWRYVKEGKVPSPIYVGRSPLWHRKTFEELVSPPVTAPRKRDISELC